MGVLRARKDTISPFIRRAQWVLLSPTAKKVSRERLTYLDAGRLRSLERALAKVRNVPGDFVEAGIALGGSAILLASNAWPPRQFHGYDVFSMIPPPSERDPQEVHDRYQTIKEGQSLGIGGDMYYGYVDDLYDQVVESFAHQGQPVDGERVRLHRGLFEDTLHPRRPVALAHIDCDWHDAVRICLERIWPHLSRGGLLVLDDYNDYGGCRAATDTFLAATPDAELAQRSPNALVRKS